MFCDFCDGVLGLLGVLGKLAHLRCRDCGASFTTDASDVLTVDA